MSEFPEKQLVIKLHPSEKLEEYREIPGMAEQKVIICRDVDLYGLLHASELLMTVHSTVALEAMILDKPVITVNLTGKPDVMPYAESGAALGVYRKEDLAPAINKALYDPEVREKMAGKREKFVYDHAYKLDGQAP
jgi:CDP-glycerol glycerophosphotransferase (TagB/SpsB family)